MARSLFDDPGAHPPLLAPREYIEEYKGRQIVQGRSIADIEESTAQLVKTMTAKGATVEEDVPPQVVRSGGATTAMTPVGTEESKLAEVKEQFKLDELRRLHEEELAKGGAIRKGRYESTGTGALIGSVAGAIVTGPTPLGPIPGAVGGAAVGEAIEQAVTPGEIPLGESISSVGEQVGYAATAEVGGALFRTVRPVRYVQPRPLTPEQMKRKDVFDTHGIPYLPHEITDSGGHKLLADLGEAGVLNPNAYKELRKDQNALRKIAINGIADQVGTHVPPDQLANQVVKVVQDSREASEAGINVLYNTIREDLKYEKVVREVPTGRMIPSKAGLVGPGTEVPELVKEEVIRGGLWTDITATKEAFNSAKMAYEDAARHLHQPDMLKAPWYETVKRATSLPEQAQWNDAHLFLKEVRAEIRRVQDAKAAGSDTATMADLGVLRKTEGILENDLKRALGTSAKPEHQRAFHTWDLAQQTVKGMSEEYRNETVLAFVRNVEKHGGEPAMKQLVTSLSPEDTQKVLRAASGAPETQRSLQRAFLEVGIERAGGLPGDEILFDPKKARNFLFGKDEFTARKTDMLIPKQQQTDIGEFLNATQEQINAQKQGKTGAVFMAMKQSGAVFTIPATALGAMGIYSAKQTDFGEAAAEIGGAVTILMAPGWIAKALQNHETAEMLIRGMKYSYSQTTIGKVTQQLFRADEAFARAVQTAANVSGVLHEPAQRATGSIMTLPSAFPLEK